MLTWQAGKTLSPGLTEVMRTVRSEKRVRVVRQNIVLYSCLLSTIANKYVETNTMTPAQNLYFLSSSVLMVVITV